MTMQPLISAYTPSNTDPELLERILVQREKMLETIVLRLKRCMTSDNKYHVLLSGPRGSGKTYFLTLVHFRLTHDVDIKNTMRIAWLGEDAVISSYIDLAREITKQLASEYPTEFTDVIPRHLQTLPADTAADAILNDMIQRLGQNHLLLMMENLDRAFQNLGEAGQKRWRAFLQETGKIATLATTQQLFEGIAKRDEAFFGFFDINHLQPLSFNDALQLMVNVAREYKKQDLVDFLQTSEGHFRVRALRHLAGGNHRMYIMLSEFLTKDSLEDLVAAFEKLAEELTPYFQERLRSLPPQQARIVQSLCNADGALTVKAVASDTFIAERNCSKQLGELKKKGIVRSSSRGKESYYEMAEPIMRLCLEIKNQRGRPLRLIALFLRAWFPSHILQSSDNLEILACSRGNVYRTYALQIENKFEAAIKTELDSEIEKSLRSGNINEALSLAEELRHTDPIHCLVKKIQVLDKTDRHDEKLVCLTELINTPSAPVQYIGEALFLRGLIYAKQGKSDLEMIDYTTLIRIPNIPVELQANALLNRGVLYGQQGKMDLEIADYTVLIGISDAPAELRVNALLNRGITYGQQGKIELALADFIPVINSPKAPSKIKAIALLSRAMAYGQQGKFKLQQTDYNCVIENLNAPSELRAEAFLNQGVVYGQQGETRLALENFITLINASDTPKELRMSALLNRGISYGVMHEFELALADFMTLINSSDTPTEMRVNAMFLRAFTYTKQKKYDLSLTELNQLSKKLEIPLHIRQDAMFLIPQARIPVGIWADAMNELKQAFEMADSNLDSYGGDPFALIKMVLQKGSTEWNTCATDLMQIYTKYNACEKLCTGLITSIECLEVSGFSNTQLDMWNAAWQSAGQNNESCTIALKALRCAVETIKTHSDRPLFQLPLEIRELILPLLSKTLTTNH